MNDIIFVIKNDSGTPQQQSVTTARDKKQKKKRKRGLVFNVFYFSDDSQT